MMEGYTLLIDEDRFPTLENIVNRACSLATLIHGAVKFTFNFAAITVGPDQNPITVYLEVKEKIDEGNLKHFNKFDCWSTTSWYEEAKEV